MSTSVKRCTISPSSEYMPRKAMTSAMRKAARAIVHTGSATSFHMRTALSSVWWLAWPLGPNIAICVPIDTARDAKNVAITKQAAAVKRMPATR